ncbi:hypothetical protein HNP25_000353 [Arcicella rosea]|uniref:Uncharacterized protein n=1 Tax=Arcicella rosea TaxID=502909 RepID=A0A841EL06_9BACT|nr:hypothetical protein [Arcicella rosea]
MKHSKIKFQLSSKELKFQVENLSEASFCFFLIFILSIVCILIPLFIEELNMLNQVFIDEFGQ